uniref:Class I SAM-dependent methyltransferase n=1 Tax=Acrobeloides nanus TaxID=290746 RepID=A0A914DV34_9BILA
MGKNEFLNFYSTFLKNMILSGLNHMVHTLRLPSAAAAHVLHCFKIDADMIYIDADHDYESVLRDVRLYYSLLKKNGIIFGDDYTPSWSAVMYAVDDFMKEMQLKVTINDGRWYTQKTEGDSKFL